jgi:acyl-CoA synthetase (AMP-forming)/AMP-acid ligase II
VADIVAPSAAVAGTGSIVRIDRSLYPRLSVETVTRYRATGEWRNRTIVDDLRDTVARDPDRILYYDEQSSVAAAELLRRSELLGATMLRWGICGSDVVSFQLPNWIEAVVVDVACAMIGAIVNPISIIYRSAELRTILSAAQSRVIFIPGHYKGRDHFAETEAIMPDLPALEKIVTVREDMPRQQSGGIYENFTALISATGIGAVDWPRVAPDSFKLLAYTSGTTGHVKGVLHTHETSARTYWSFFHDHGLRPSDIMFMPSTVTHATGYTYGMQLPLVHGTSTLFMDGWEPRRAHDLIKEHHATVTVGAVPFVLDLAEIVESSGQQLSSIRLFGCGGAAVTPNVIEKGRVAFPNARLFRLYGSTETGNVTSGFIDPDDADLASGTDGRISDCEVRLMQLDNAEAGSREGEILVKGPATFVGYVDAGQTAEAFSEDGFFRTGDVGVLGEKNSLTITGRTKDIIIRGGYNISAKEVEDRLNAHPLVRDLAVVGRPHPRLGETICAFIIPAQANRPPTVADLLEYLERQGLAKQKIPEHVRIVTELPRTPAGKVKKFILREMLAEEVRQENANADCLVRGA